MYSHWWKRWCPNYVFRAADLTLCVSEFNRQQTLRHTGADKSRVRLVYHGFDYQRWQPVPDVKREPIVLTVGRVTAETSKIKGIALLVEAARHAEDIDFYVVGPIAPDAKQLPASAPPNVTFTGGLYGEDLLRMYSRAKVYVQASVHESFGCSVAEAMLCGCTPVVSRHGALPEVVGDAGFYVEELSPQALAAQIRTALQSNKGAQASSAVEQGSAGAAEDH